MWIGFKAYYVVKARFVNKGTQLLRQRKKQKAKSY